MSANQDAARREAAWTAVVTSIVEAGFPREFGVVVADSLGGPWSLERMAAYVRGAHPQTPEDIADEMLAILEQRQRWVEQKRSEEANAAITRFYNRPHED